MSKFIPSGLGWQRDLPDPRDYTAGSHDVLTLLHTLPVCACTLPRKVDIRADSDGSYFSPVDDQKNLNSSAAFACLALVEYFERKTLGRTYEGSPLFLYRASRKFLGAQGNVGVSIRTTIKTLKRYGAPPEELLPYSCDETDSPVDLWHLGFAREMEGLLYFRLDTAEQSGADRLNLLKSFLAAQFPVTIGFSVPRSLSRDGVVPCRQTSSGYLDSYRGGQAVLAVGYDDEGFGNQGAVIIRNSWGTAWGSQGYGWLPYRLVANSQVADLWTVFKSEWSRSGVIYMPVFA